MTIDRESYMERVPLRVLVSSSWLSLKFRAPRAYLYVGGFSTAPWPQGDFQIPCTSVRGYKSGGRSVQLNGSCVWFHAANDRTYADVYGALFSADVRRQRVHAAYCDQRLLGPGGRGRAGGGVAIVPHLILRALSRYSGPRPLRDA